MALEEPRDPVTLIRRDARQHALCRVHVPAQDRSLVLDHCQREGVRGNVHVLVRDVEAVVRGKVSKEVDGSRGGSVVSSRYPIDDNKAVEWSKWMVGVRVDVLTGRNG